MARAPEVAAPLPPIFADENQTRSEPPPQSREISARPGPDLRPKILERPIERPARPSYPEPFPQPETLFRQADDPPLRYTGPSGITPTETQQSSHFVPIEDRWRIGFPGWDRYGKGHPREDEYPYMPGRLFDPYNQNVLKGMIRSSASVPLLDVTGGFVARFRGPDGPDANFAVRKH